MLKRRPAPQEDTRGLCSSVCHVHFVLRTSCRTCAGVLGPFYPTVPGSSIRSCPGRPASVSPYVTRRRRRERAIDKSDKAIFHSPFSQHCFCERRATSALSTFHPGGGPRGVSRPPRSAQASNGLLTRSHCMFIVVCEGVLHTCMCVWRFRIPCFLIRFGRFPPSTRS